jgi:hypothetical protein
MIVGSEKVPVRGWGALDRNHPVDGDREVKKLAPRKSTDKADKPEPPPREAPPPRKSAEKEEVEVPPAPVPVPEGPKGLWANVEQWDDQGQVAGVRPGLRSSHRATVSPPAPKKEEGGRKKEKKEDGEKRREKKPKAERARPEAAEKPEKPDKPEQEAPPKPPAKSSPWDKMKGG